MEKSKQSKTLKKISLKLKYKSPSCKALGIQVVSYLSPELWGGSLESGDKSPARGWYCLHGEESTHPNTGPTQEEEGKTRL